MRADEEAEQPATGRCRGLSVADDGWRRRDIDAPLLIRRARLLRALCTHLIEIINHNDRRSKMERVSPMLARFAGHMRKHSNTGACLYGD